MSPSQRRPATVLIIEDHLMIAESLHAAIDRVDDVVIVGMAGTLAEGERLARTLQPDVIVLDFRLPDGDAPDVMARLLGVRDGTRVLVLSALSDYRSVVRALEAGASGYLLKDQTLDELIAAVRVVRSGGQALAPSLVPRLMSRLTRSPSSADRLSRRELEVLQLLSEGLSTADLASRLHLSVNTVRNHIQNAISRLGAHSKLEAVSIALRDGLITPPDKGLAPAR